MCVCARVLVNTSMQSVYALGLLSQWQAVPDVPPKAGTLHDFDVL